MLTLSRAPVFRRGGPSVQQAVAFLYPELVLKVMWQNLSLSFDFDNEGHTIEPKESSELSSFDSSLKKALDYKPNEQ